MRLWSIGIGYMTNERIREWWRNLIMAKNALRNKKHPYHKHAQLQRFRNHAYAFDALNAQMEYLSWFAKPKYIYLDFGFIDEYDEDRAAMHVTIGQLWYELLHLHNRMISSYWSSFTISEFIRNQYTYTPLSHAPFRLTDGPVAYWEKTVSKERYHVEYNPQKGYHLYCISRGAGVYASPERQIACSEINLWKPLLKDAKRGVPSY